MATIRPAHGALPRSKSSYRVLLDADTPWKDSERLAQFIANVAGGSLVVLGTASYVAQIVKEAISETPPSATELLQDYAARLLALVAAGVEEAWATAVFYLSQRYSYDDLLANPRVMAKPLAVVASVLAIVVVICKFKSVGWFCGLQIVIIIQWVIALYQMVRIAVSLSLYLTVKAFKFGISIVRRAFTSVFRVRGKQIELLRQLMKTTRSYPEWAQMARHLDVLEGKEDWKLKINREDLEFCDFSQVERNIATLTRVMTATPVNIEELKYVVASHIIRNELGVDAPNLHLDCHSGTKKLITEYNQLVIQALDTLAAASPGVFPVEDKLQFFRHLKLSFGSTALCLSGGGALAMYHMGVVRALLEADLLPNVVSGSSGGSITAAFIACKTKQELLDQILVTDVSTRYFSLGIRWFPPLLEQLAHCIKTGFLIESSDFERTTSHYYSEPMDSSSKMMHYTFQDAFEKTGRHVCITVSASDITGHKGPKKLLLSHVNTPHVLLWSAVAVSCSLPGIMKGKQLMARDFNGNIVPYSSLEKEWVDGSIQHDLPMETMASRFEVTNFIVSQVNPHVVPFVGDEIDRPDFRKSVFHKLESVIAGDIRHRLKMLAFLGLFPKIYGHQFSSYLKQNFSGNVTLVPDFILLEAIGIKAILNPTVEDMTRYIEGGQRTVWPKLAYIRHLSSIERCLDGHVETLRALGAVGQLADDTGRGEVENWHARGEM
jgi:predicted acylesterase/phospholipase RssA